MDETIRWTNLSHQQIADKLNENDGIKISRNIVKQLFKLHGYKKRKAQKSLSIGECKDRNEQFENIAKLKRDYINARQSDHKYGYKEKRVYREPVSRWKPVYA